MPVTTSDIMKVFTRSFREWTRSIDACDAAMARGNARLAIQNLSAAFYSNSAVEYTMRLLGAELDAEPDSEAERRALAQIDLVLKAARPRIEREGQRQMSLLRELVSVAKIPARWRPPPRSLHGLPYCCPL